MVGKLMLVSALLTSMPVSLWASPIEHKHKNTKNFKTVTAESQSHHGVLLSSETPHLCISCTHKSWTWRHHDLCLCPRFTT